MPMYKVIHQGNYFALGIKDEVEVVVSGNEVLIVPLPDTLLEGGSWVDSWLRIQLLQTSR